MRKLPSFAGRKISHMCAMLSGTPLSMLGNKTARPSLRVPGALQCFTRFTLPLLTLMLFLPACAAEHGHQPGVELGVPITSNDPATLLSLLISTSTPESSRLAADKLYISLKSPTDPTRLNLLEQILYAPGQSDAMRIYALDQLAAAEPARAIHALDLYLPRFDSPVLDHACDLAITLGDPRLLSPLARSLDRLASDDATAPAQLLARPEISAIKAISAQPAPTALTDLLLHDTQSTTRAAALDILQKITADNPVARIRAITQGSSDAFLADIFWWADSFNALPVGGQEIDWVRTLHRPENAPLVSRALDRHKLLADQSDYHLTPRFITTLAYIDDATLRLSRRQLLDQLQSRLAPLPHARRVPAYPGSAEDKDDSLPANEKLLSRCDLFNLHLLLNALQSPATLAEFQRQGLADLADTSTEHGGLLALQNIQSPSLLISPYAPLYAGNDLEYITDDKLLRQVPLGLALYHFHFQQIHNADRAGPGEGDLQFARAHRVDCVVITSINTRETDFDYYTPNGAVIDLGVYQSP